MKKTVFNSILVACPVMVYMKLNLKILGVMLLQIWSQIQIYLAQNNKNQKIHLKLVGFLRNRTLSVMIVKIHQVNSNNIIKIVLLEVRVI